MLAQRHQAVYNDLLNEIDGLDSDGEDEVEPQPVSKPVSYLSFTLKFIIL